MRLAPAEGRLLPPRTRLRRFIPPRRYLSLAPGGFASPRRRQRLLPPRLEEVLAPVELIGQPIPGLRCPPTFPNGAPSRRPATRSARDHPRSVVNNRPRSFVPSTRGGAVRVRTGLRDLEQHHRLHFIRDRCGRRRGDADPPARPSSVAPLSGRRGSRRGDPGHRAGPGAPPFAPGRRRPPCGGERGPTHWARERSGPGAPRRPCRSRVSAS